MPIPTHFAHVYQRPMQGTTFIRRHPTFNYQHSIVNRGWFDTASYDLAVQSEAEGFSLFNAYLGCRVAIYVDNPAQPIWEGLINRITFNAGGISYTISLDEMANRLSVVYTGATNAAAETPLVNNTISQSIYGIKQDQIEFGVDPSAGTHRTQLRDTMLAQRAFPQTATSQAQGQSNLVHIECIGVYHTLEWEKYFSGISTATQPASTLLAAIVSTIVANGTTFFTNTNTTQITTNAYTSPVQNRAISIWEWLMRITEAGDGTNYWVCGVLPTNTNTGQRLFYYRVANTAIEYTALQADGLKPRNQFGKPIPPWLVVPDRGIRVNDVLTGYDSNIMNDPTETYIQSIQYDANSQKVQWFGADDTTARAAFMLNRTFLPIARDFGAPLRNIST